MNALLLTLFVSSVLLASGLVSFVGAWKRRDHQHADRLALLPLDDDETAAASRNVTLPGDEPRGSMDVNS